MAEATLADQILQDIKADPSIVDNALEAVAPEQTPLGETRPEIVEIEPETPVLEETPTPVEGADATIAEVKPTTVEDQIKSLTDMVKDLAAKVANPVPQTPVQPAQPTISADQNDLLAGVNDEPALLRAEKDLEELVRFAETHREGAYDYEVKDASGNTVKKDFTPEQVTNIKIRAEAALRAIPKRREYINLRQQYDSKAQEIYPELSKNDSPWRKNMAQILAAVPQLVNVPDFAIWIGHALRGRDAFLKEKAGHPNGNGKSKAVEKIKGAPKEVAPAVVNTRGTIAPTEKRKQEAALSALKKQGTQEAAEEYLATLGF